MRSLPKAISGGHVLAIAMTEPGADSDLAGMRARAEPAPGGDGWILNGAKTCISNGLHANVLGDPTRGFQHMARLLTRERLSLALTSMAHAQTAFDLTLDYIKARRAFGRPIGTFQNSRFVMAQLRAELDALQVFVDQCVGWMSGRRGSDSAFRGSIRTRPGSDDFRSVDEKTCWRYAGSVTKTA